MDLFKMRADQNKISESPNGEMNIRNCLLILHLTVLIIACGRHGADLARDGSVNTDSLGRELMEAKLDAYVTATDKIRIPTSLPNDTFFVVKKPIFLYKDLDSIATDIPADNGNYVVVEKSDETISWFVLYDKKNSNQGRYRAPTYQALSFFVPDFEEMKIHFYDELYRLERVNRKALALKYAMSLEQIDSAAESNVEDRIMELQYKFDQMRVNYRKSIGRDRDR